MQRSLQKLGLSLTWIRGDNALPDSCFVEDTAVVVEEKAVICNMRAESRANEVVEIAKVMGELKDTYRIKPPATIDGGDALVVEDRVLVGISARTNLHAVIQLKKILEITKGRFTPEAERRFDHKNQNPSYHTEDRGQVEPPRE